MNKHKREGNATVFTEVVMDIVFQFLAFPDKQVFGCVSSTAKKVFENLPQFSFIGQFRRYVDSVLYKERREQLGYMLCRINAVITGSTSSERILQLLDTNEDGSFFYAKYLLNSKHRVVMIGNSCDHTVVHFDTDKDSVELHPTVLKMLEAEPAFANAVAKRPILAQETRMHINFFTQPRPKNMEDEMAVSQATFDSFERQIIAACNKMHDTTLLNAMSQYIRKAWTKTEFITQDVLNVLPGASSENEQAFITDIISRIDNITGDRYVEDIIEMDDEDYITDDEIWRVKSSFSYKTSTGTFKCTLEGSGEGESTHFELLVNDETLVEADQGGCLEMMKDMSKLFGKEEEFQTLGMLVLLIVGFSVPVHVFGSDYAPYEGFDRQQSLIDFIEDYGYDCSQNTFTASDYASSEQE
jgi:hypothetical protein